MSRDEPARATEPLLFAAVLHPRRSLGRTPIIGAFLSRPERASLCAALAAALARCRFLPVLRSSGAAAAEGGPAPAG